MLARLLTIAFTILLLGSAGCEKTDHDTIDKWMRTEKGPGKLKKAFTSESLDPDLSAHAGVNMILTGKDTEVYAALDAMSPGRRTQVVNMMVPRLWNVARIAEEKQLPTPSQVTAKDALFTIRKHADDAGRAKIDENLTSWYAVMSYEGRASAGISGAKIMRTLGPAAGKKLASVLNQFIATPGQDKVRYKIKKPLLLGLAASGDPDAVKYVLDLVSMDRGDKDLPKLAMDVLYIAYVDPTLEDFDLVPPDALIPNIPLLSAIAKDDRQPGSVVNSALALIRVTGTPHCLEPLMSMVGSPHNNPIFRYVSASNAIRCGGHKVIAEVVEKLPPGEYDLRAIQGTFAYAFNEMKPTDKVKDQLRTLLDSKSTLAKWVAIESLAWMDSKEDFGRFAALTSSKDKLAGFWGDDEDPAKKVPTLGERAKQLQNGLPPEDAAYRAKLQDPKKAGSSEAPAQAGSAAAGSAAAGSAAK